MDCVELGVLVDCQCVCEGVTGVCCEEGGDGCEWECMCMCEEAVKGVCVCVCVCVCVHAFVYVCG